MHALPEATRKYRDRFPNTASSVLGRTGLHVSKTGFGGYRITEQNSTHREALRLALLNGINLIDTSANYADGGSELLVGSVIQDLIQEGRLNREEVVVVTKAGYVQGQNMVLARTRMGEGRPFPEMTEFQPECWHCIHPEFLEDQITRSLDRLSLDQIDVLLLHNPEYFLKHSPDHAEYYRRIEAAFRYLETEVARGRIMSYGVSSNTFIEPKNDPEFTSLEVLIEIAEAIGPQNRFSTIQFPLNLIETGAVTENNCTQRTLVEFAETKNLGTLANRPLNSYLGSQLYRFSEPRGTRKDVAEAESNLQSAFMHALPEEARFAKTSGVGARTTWVKALSDHRLELGSLWRWLEIKDRQIAPFLGSLGTPAAQAYRTKLAELCDALTDWVLAVEASRAGRVKDALKRHCPSPHESASLAQRAICAIQALPGVNCVLLGMRTPHYVQDVLSLPSAISTEAAHQALDGAAVCVASHWCRAV